MCLQGKRWLRYAEQEQLLKSKEILKVPDVEVEKWL